MKTNSGANFQIQYGFYTHHKIEEGEEHGEFKEAIWP